VGRGQLRKGRKRNRKGMSLEGIRSVILVFTRAHSPTLPNLVINHGYLFTALVFTGVSAYGEAVFTAQVIRVSDGDTLWVQPDSGGPRLKLRLEGIDAPELCQARGDASRAALQALTFQRTLEVKIRTQDDYGRALAHLTFHGQDIGAEMVRTGQAWSYRWRHSIGPYMQEERSARLGRRGIFSQDGGQLPREFRQQHGSCFPRKP
jgi:micrococcal nuclease